jgi:hypothetical protein
MLRDRLPQIDGGMIAGKYDAFCLGHVDGIPGGWTDAVQQLSASVLLRQELGARHRTQPKTQKTPLPGGNGV